MSPLPSSPQRHAHLQWPFFSPEHTAFVERVEGFARSGALDDVDHHDVDASCRKLVARLGQAGLLRACVPGAYGGLYPEIDSRAVALARECLAYHDGLADFAFVMQGLGSGAIGLAGSEELKSAILPRVAKGELIPAFALSEKDAGSDVAAMQCRAREEAGSYVLTGEKTWISNGGIADVYVVFARTGEGAAAGTRGISALVVYADDPGFSIVERIEVMAPHPLATLRFDGVRLPVSRMLGAPGEGFKLAMRSLDIFRVSVAGAALGFSRRALDEALQHAAGRRMFGGTLADLQVTQAKLGRMATLVDSSALLTYRAAWLRDVVGVASTREAAMAKLAATENAQVVVDAALQMFGGRGVKVGEVLERLYREVRALRIYEGATEVQELIVAREMLKGVVLE